MSTVFFGAGELGNLARVAAEHPRRQPRLTGDELQSICAALAAFSVVNAQAYDVRYPAQPSAVPVTAEEIVGAARRTSHPSVLRALRTYQLLHYNTDGLMPDDVAAKLQVVAIYLVGHVADVLEPLP
jgi:hypothetical protein